MFDLGVGSGDALKHLGKVIMKWMGVKTHYGGQKMFSQIFFQNCVTFNFHQHKIKRGFHTFYSK
jgi:hypothetical protein